MSVSPYDLVFDYDYWTYGMIVEVLGLDIFTMLILFQLKSLRPFYRKTRCKRCLKDSHRWGTCVCFCPT